MLAFCWTRRKHGSGASSPSPASHPMTAAMLQQAEAHRERSERVALATGALAGLVELVGANTDAWLALLVASALHRARELREAGR